MCEQEFELAEFNQNYEMARHLARVQHEVFKTFLTVYLAIWGGHILAVANNVSDLEDLLLVIGFVANLLFLSVMISNRVYFKVNMAKIEHMRQVFLYADSELWRDYPQFYPEMSRELTPSKEQHEVMRWHSAFAWRIGLMCFGNAALFYEMGFIDSTILFSGWKLVASALLWMLQIYLCSIFSCAKDKRVWGRRETTKT